MSRLIEYTYSRPGKGSELYEHLLVADEPDVKILLMADHRGEPLMIDGKVAVEPGSALLWFVFPGAWHDIGRFHLADDTLTGWYTNLCTPVEMRGNSWASTDLFLDHWMTPDGSQSWLDEDELADAIGAGLVNQDAQAKIDEERRSIQARLDLAEWPPRVALDMDLHHARGLLGK